MSGAERGNRWLWWIGGLVLLFINGVLLTNFGRGRKELPVSATSQVVPGNPIHEHPHGKRVIAETARVSALTLDELEDQLDNEWTIYWSGAKSGGSLRAEMDFPRILACRLRRRFIQETDRKPPEVRRQTARRVYDEWLVKQRRHYEESLQYIQDPSLPNPNPRGGGLRLAIATGLFCCARWSNTVDVLHRIESTRRFSDELRDRLDEIPGATDASKVVMPQSVVPDDDCLISILVYSARRDIEIGSATREKLEELLSEFHTVGLLSGPIEWNAWDARFDSFDIEPLKTSERAIERRPVDEQITMFRFAGSKHQSGADANRAMLERIIALLRSN